MRERIGPIARLRSPIRLTALLLALASAAIMTASPAGADRSTQSIVGDAPIDCDGVVLSPIGGVVVQRFHEHALRDGTYRLIFSTRLSGAEFEDTDGNLYRASGHAEANS